MTPVEEVGWTKARSTPVMGARSAPATVCRHPPACLPVAASLPVAEAGERVTELVADDRDGLGALDIGIRRDVRNGLAH